MTDAEGIVAFVRLAATTLDPDLARWTAARVWAGLSASRRRRVRDELLREAGRHLPPSSAWQKAHTLADLARSPGSRLGVTTAPGLVALATSVYCPERRDRHLSAAQIFRVVSRKWGGEMQVSEAVDSRSMLDLFVETER